MPISSNIKSSKMNFLQHPRVSRAPSLCHRRAQGEGWRGPAPQAEDAPRGARDPGRPGRGTRAADGRGGGEAAGGDVRGWEAGPTISSSPGAEGEREVPKAPPPSALPPLTVAPREAKSSPVCALNSPFSAKPRWHRREHSLHSSQSSLDWGSETEYIGPWLAEKEGGCKEKW